MTLLPEMSVMKIIKPKNDVFFTKERNRREILSCWLITSKVEMNFVTTVRKVTLGTDIIIKIEKREFKIP